VGGAKQIKHSTLLVAVWQPAHTTNWLQLCLWTGEYSVNWTNQCPLRHWLIPSSRHFRCNWYRQTWLNWIGSTHNGDTSWHERHGLGCVDVLSTLTHSTCLGGDRSVFYSQLPSWVVSSLYRHFFQQLISVLFFLLCLCHSYTI